MKAVVAFVQTSMIGTPSPGHETAQWFGDHSEITSGKKSTRLHQTTSKSGILKISSTKLLVSVYISSEQDLQPQKLFKRSSDKRTPANITCKLSEYSNSDLIGHQDCRVFLFVCFLKARRRGKKNIDDSFSQDLKVPPQ